MDPVKQNVKLNALAKQILMLLPLLVLLLPPLHVLYHVLIRGRFAPPYNYVVSTYSRSSRRSSRGNSIKICCANSFSLTFSLSGSTKLSLLKFPSERSRSLTRTLFLNSVSRTWRRIRLQDAPGVILPVIVNSCLPIV